MKIIVAVLVVACASFATAQEQEYKCTTPPVWYGHFQEYSPTRNEERLGRIYYDEPNERIAIREEDIPGLPNNITYYREIFDHKAMVGYRIENRTGYCTKFTLREPFPKIGPYLSDEYDGEAYIGSAAKPKDGVRVVMYSGSIPERGSFFGVWIPVDEETCLPVSESFTRESDMSTNTRRYYDLRLGIFDYDVFQPPANCA